MTIEQLGEWIVKVNAAIDGIHLLLLQVAGDMDNIRQRLDMLERFAIEIEDRISPQEPTP